MCRKLIFLVPVVLVLAVCSSALAKKTVQYKVDLCPSNYDPPNNYDGTHKGGDWLVWDAWGNIDPDHDGRTLWNVGGLPLHIFMGMDGGHGYNNYDTVEGEVPGPIANGWVKHRSPDEGPPGASFHVVVWGDAMAPGEYRIYAYHNDPEVSRPNMPSIIATTYCAANQKANCGCPVAPDCNIGVIQIPLGEPCDINVPVQNHTGTDDALVASEVRFISDGTPALITYEAPDGNTAVFNAFIIELDRPVVACGPSPVMNKIDVCPDKVLTWYAGAYADTQDVYLGTDYNDVNDATTLFDPNNVYMGSQPVADCNYDPCGLLDFNETYYWRVDTANDVCDPCFWKGNVWSFTTEDGKAGNPSPAHPQFSVATNSTLSWEPSCLANYHDVYFSTDYNAVNDGTDPNSGAGQGRQPETTFDPEGLEAATRYYWRIDEVGDTTFIEGDVWTFVTIGGTLFHFEFDGVIDANVHDPGDEIHLTDSTGNVVFTIIENGTGDRLKYAEPNPLYNTVGTSADFRSDEGPVGLYRGSIHSVPPVRGIDITDLTAPTYTIEMWVRPDSFDEDTRLIGKRTGAYAIDLTDDGMVLFSQADANAIGDVNSIIQEGLWYHIAGVFDSNDPCEPQKLYIDGEVVASGGTTSTNPIGNDESATIGISTYMDKGYEKRDDSYDGLIDELRVSDVVLSPGQFLMRGDRGLAWMPRPKDYIEEVPYDVNMTWKPGDLASSHKVFFGETWEDVNSMTDPCAVQDACEYDPGVLDLAATYFWRIDELDESNDYTWTGSIWRFKVADYIVIDNFESYNETDNKVAATWWDNGSNATGSWCSLAQELYGKPVYSGEKAMFYEYYTDAPPQWWWITKDYAEAWLQYDPPMDWVTPGVRLLTLFFYGQSGNDYTDAEQMYVGVEDNGGLYAEMRYGYNGEDMNDINEPEWHSWHIPLVWFADGNFTECPCDVDWSSIFRFSIGFGDRRNPVPAGEGAVYFDDIQLSLPICIPEYAAYDLSGDCVVGLADVGVMGEQWLRGDINFPDLGITVEPPNDANLVGHWKLDEGDGNNVDDSSIYDNNGTAEGDYTWVTGRIGPYAMEFDGGRVDVPDACELRPKHQVSVTTWIYIRDDMSSARVVVKGENDHETYEIEVDDDDTFVFQFRDANHPNHARYDVNGTVWPYEWIHLAGTYDGNVIACYVNGLLEDAKDIDNPHGLAWNCPDPCGLAIGNKAKGDADDADFEGTIDDVRVYDYGLSQAEVAWLASEEDGLIPLTKKANFFIDDPDPEVINFKDFAVLLEHWLDPPVLWPPEQ